MSAASPSTTLSGKIRQKLTSVKSFKPFLRFRLWFIPLVVVLLLVMGWWMRVTLEASVRQRTADKLQAILDANVTALELWLNDQRAYATVLSSSERVRKAVMELEDLWRTNPEGLERLRTADALTELRDKVMPLYERHGFDGFAVIAPDGTMIADDTDKLIGERIETERTSILSRGLAGETVVSHPFFVESTAPSGEDEVPRSGRAIMVVAAPVYDNPGRVVAVLALVIDPDLDFTRILQSARLAESGETYAFNAQGLMISHSRFDDQLRAIGLIPDDPGSDALLTLEIRDPGGDLTKGFTPTLDRGAQPLTHMAAYAVTGQDGVDVQGYRDYRGVEVVGAWTWLEDYNLGITSEMDLAEAIAMPSELRKTFWIVVGAFVLIAGLVLGGTLFVTRMGRQMSDALVKAQRLGQYTLEKKLGEGGMGQVFRASHAMLRRPTAIKLLHPDRAGKQALARFEREVQITSNLTHPNTIAIFDYGRTPDGVFYYAMEYLPGIDLARLVEIDGAQTEGRVIYILRQVCGSLEEAHAHGLIHRDIKPENIILCERGGRYDVAKVLDFGIVKELGGGSATQLTAVDGFTGTPLYVAPEVWTSPETIDARADIYALGVVAYLLLTGKRLFEANTVMEIYDHHVKTPPVPPSEHVSGISGDIEAVVLRCLSKAPDERPQTARELAEALEACAAAGAWNDDNARAWWGRHAGEIKGQPDAGDATDTASPSGVTSTVVADVGRGGT